MNLPFFLLVAITSTVFANDRFIEQCTAYFSNPIITEELKHVRTCSHHTRMREQEVTDKKESPLFRAYPELKKNIAHINLGRFETPIEYMQAISEHANRTIYIKRDDQCGKINQQGQRLFGGNKVRKLEFLLADALQHNYKTVMTFGAAGSNHSTATAAYAQNVGLNCICMLLPQPNSPIVQRNLLLHQQYNTHLHIAQTETLRELGAFYTCLRHAQKHNQYPYIIPTGGSCPLGVLGFVNAVFELHEQIKKGAMPEPDYIYVPVGSGGTIAGLLIGIKMLNMKTKVVGVAACDDPFNDIVQTLFEQTAGLLNNLIPNLPKLTLQPDDINISYEYYGKGYGEFTERSIAAMKLVEDLHNITLDPTYSSKGFAGMLDRCKQHNEDDVILYWCTFDGTDFSDILQQVSYKTAPLALHEYFA